MNWPPQWKVLWLGVLVSFPGLAFAACGLPDGLNEKKQFAFAQKMIADGFDKCPRLSSMLPRQQTPRRISLCRYEIRRRSASSNGGKLLAPGSNSFEEWLQENPNDSEEILSASS